MPEVTAVLIFKSLGYLAAGSLGAILAVKAEPLWAKIAGGVVLAIALYLMISPFV